MPEQKQNNGGQAKILNDVPENISVMEKAILLQEKAAEHGFDWPTLEPIFAKLQEEIQELKDEIVLSESADLKESSYHKMKDELGDVIFCCMNLARFLKINPEQALNSTNRKFERRFNFIEAQLESRGQVLKEASLDELDEVWEQAKKKGL